MIHHTKITDVSLSLAGIQAVVTHGRRRADVWAQEGRDTLTEGRASGQAKWVRARMAEQGCPISCRILIGRQSQQIVVDRSQLTETQFSFRLI